MSGHGRYGRKPRDHSRAALRLEDYVTGVRGSLPAVRGDVDRASAVSSWPMYANDAIGDCTCAAIGHMVQAWTAYAGTEVVIPESEIVNLYSAVSGYDPSTGANDNGAEMQDVLAYMRTHGVRDTGGKLHTVAGYAAFTDPADQDLLARVLNTFGTVYVGINCPASALSQFDNGQPWSYVAGSPIDGGHAICLQRRAVGGVGVLRYVTWGALQRTTRSFHNAYADEAWAVVSSDWLEANGESPEGLDLAQLLADMQYVG